MEESFSFASVRVIKKNGKEEPFDAAKIEKAVQSSKARLDSKFTPDEIRTIVSKVKTQLQNAGAEKVPVATIHIYVENALDEVDPSTANQYRSWRNYKADMQAISADALATASSLSYHADHSNANSDSELISTKRSLKYKAFSKGVYKRFFLTPAERQAVEDGYFYVHDISDRLDTMNCCLCDMGAILKGGFDMENMHYTEPTSIGAAINVMCDVMQMAGSQQYGGFTVPEVDTVLEPYAEKSYKKYLAEYASLMIEINHPVDPEKAAKYAYSRLDRELEQGFQALEYNLNTVASSRGDFIFTTFTFGLDPRPMAKRISETILRVRGNGEGAKENRIPAVFPKLVFLYDEEKHGKGGVLEDLYKKAVVCSSKAQYPDYLSLSGEGYVASVYKKYKNGVMRWYLDEDGKVAEDPNWHDNVISPMGCRAYLSLYYRKGGFHPADESDLPVFTGRWNGGAISLNLPMILRKSQLEKLPFYELLDHYLEMIREVHKRTYEYLAKIKASCNPLMFTQGGFYNGHLQPDEEIRPLLDYVTFSFGFTALNETQMLYNGKYLDEDNDFAYEVLQHVNRFSEAHKEEDHILWAIYGTPAESLCYTQRDQFVRKYGITNHVGEHQYFSNSFHNPVWVDIDHFEKMDRESSFFHIANGGHICYTRIPTGKNLIAIDEEIKYAMKLGLYFGVNIAKSYCNSCGEQWDDDKLDECPHCHSQNITSISRVCGYLGFTRQPSNNPRQKSRIADKKLTEIKERKAM